MIVKYYKYMAVAVGVFLWLFFVGPRMLSGPTETFVGWWALTIFGLVPALYYFVMSQIKAKKEPENK